MGSASDRQSKALPVLCAFFMDRSDASFAWKRNGPLTASAGAPREIVFSPQRKPRYTWANAVCVCGEIRYRQYNRKAVPMLDAEPPTLTNIPP
jgi:hypothetical protein